MAQYHFNTTLVGTHSAGDSTLTLNKFQEDLITGEDLNLLSILKEGDYVYGVDNSVFEIGTQVKRDYNSEDINLNNFITATAITIVNGKVKLYLSKPLLKDIASGTKIEFVFERFINTVGNKSLIGFDRNTPQEVKVESSLFDSITLAKLTDAAGNDLFTDTNITFLDTITSANATGVVLAAGSTVKVEEQFPESSSVSASLLGVPRAETQLSLFSDVSTLGFESDNWEIFKNVSSGYSRYIPWENRATESGINRYNTRVTENTTEQALEITAFPVPYSFPWTPLTNRGQNAQYSLFLNFVRLGNFLYLAYEKDPGIYGADIKNRFLDPSKVTLKKNSFNTYDASETTEIYTLHYPEYETPEAAAAFQSEAFRLIDIWTDTWVKIKLNKFKISSSTLFSVLTSGAIEAADYDVMNATGWKDNGTSETVSFYNNASGSKSLASPIGLFSLKQLNQQGWIKVSAPGYDFGQSTQDSIILQSKEAFRYQPGRVSGFTFGARAVIDKEDTTGKIEWGIQNKTDSYLFRIRGASFQIVRRSTIPLSDKSLELNGILGKQTLIPAIGQDGGVSLDPFTGESLPDIYETVIPQSLFNNDTLQNLKPTDIGYILDVEKVTMWKVEFSWYGAVGAKFYAYVPVDNNEARWVLMHTLLIENTLDQPCLEDPFFKMVYRIDLANKSTSLAPQFVFKYGSSVYIDGGDEGTKRQYSYTAEEKPVKGNDIIPLIGLKPKKNIENSLGIKKENRKLVYPSQLNTSVSDFSQLDFIECEACPGFAFTYDNGLIANTVGETVEDSELTESPRIDFHIEIHDDIRYLALSKMDVQAKIAELAVDSGGDPDRLSARYNPNVEYINGAEVWDLSVEQDRDNYFGLEDDDAHIIHRSVLSRWIAFKETYQEFKTAVSAASEAGVAKFGYALNDVLGDQLPSIEDFKTPIVRLKTKDTFREYEVNIGMIGMTGAAPGTNSLIAVGNEIDYRRQAVTTYAQSVDAIAFPVIADSRFIDSEYFDGSEENGLREYSYVYQHPAIIGRKRHIGAAATPISGRNNEVRFLNPTQRHSPEYSTGGCNFEIGFTDKKPIAGGATEEELRGFDYGDPNNPQPLKAIDFLGSEWYFQGISYTDRNALLAGRIASDGTSRETTWANVNRFQMDYRIKPIPSDNYESNGSLISSVPSTGGVCSKIKLNVADVESFTGLRFFDVEPGNTLTNVLSAATLFTDNDILSRYDVNAIDPDTGEPPHPDFISNEDITTEGQYLIIDNNSFNDAIEDDNGIKTVDFVNGQLGLNNEGAFTTENDKIVFITDALSFTYDNDGSLQSAYLFKLSGTNATLETIASDGNDGTSLTKFSFTSVQVVYTIGGSGVEGANFTNSSVPVEKSNSKIFSFNPYPLYLVVKMEDGSVINNINILQEDADDRTVTSPTFLLNENAKVSYPLGDTHEDTITNVNAITIKSETFQDVDRLSSLEIDLSAGKRLRRMFDKSDFRSKLKYYDGNFTSNTYSTRLKSLSTYFVGGESASRSIKKFQLDSIFGEDRIKVQPGFRDSTAYFVIGKTLNLADESEEINNMQVSINTAEI